MEGRISQVHILASEGHIHLRPPPLILLYASELLQTSYRLMALDFHHTCGFSHSRTYSPSSHTFAHLPICDRRLQIRGSRKSCALREEYDQHIAHKNSWTNRRRVREGLEGEVAVWQFREDWNLVVVSIPSLLPYGRNCFFSIHSLWKGSFELSSSLAFLRKVIITSRQLSEQSSFDNQ